MPTFAATDQPGTQYALCFRSMFHTGRGYFFPCDSNGYVDLNALSETARMNYFFARGVVGREFFVPAVECTLH